MSTTSLETKTASAETADAADDPTLAEAVAAAGPFKDLPQAVLDAVCETAEKRSYAAGEPVFALGQYDASDFFLVFAGRLKAAIADPKNGAMLFDEIVQGTIFGLELAICEKRTTAVQQITLTAESDAELIVFDSEAFRAVVAQRPSLTRNIMHYFAGELSKMRVKSLDEGYAPEQRVFAALMEFIERDPVAGVWRIERMPKHRELADKANVDETTAAAAVALLIQEGVARREYPGLVINDIERLNCLLG